MKNLATMHVLSFDSYIVFIKKKKERGWMNIHFIFEIKYDLLITRIPV